MDFFFLNLAYMLFNFFVDSRLWKLRRKKRACLTKMIYGGCRYWSLKEAYVKAIGTGITHGLDKVEFHRSSWANISVKIAGRATPEWRFWLSELGKRHLVNSLSLAFMFFFPHYYCCSLCLHNLNFPNQIIHKEKFHKIWKFQRILFILNVWNDGKTEFRWKVEPIHVYIVDFFFFTFLCPNMYASNFPLKKSLVSLWKTGISSKRSPQISNGELQENVKTCRVWWRRIPRGSSSSEHGVRLSNRRTTCSSFVQRRLQYT